MTENEQAAQVLDDHDGYTVLDKVKKRDLKLLLDPELIEYARKTVRRGIKDGPGAHLAQQACGHLGMHVKGAQAVLMFTWTRRAIAPPGVQRAMKAGIQLPVGMGPGDWPQWEVEQLIFKLWDHRNAVWQRGSNDFCHLLMDAWFPNTPWMEEDLDPATEADNTVHIPKHRVFLAFYRQVPDKLVQDKRAWAVPWVPAPSLRDIFGAAPKPRELPKAILPFDPEDQEDEEWVEQWNARPRPITCTREG